MRKDRKNIKSDFFLKNLPEEAKKEADRELNRLSRMHPSSAEYTVASTYLDWITSLPWHDSSPDNLDIKKARKILDEDHYGLDEVKDRIIEYLAVQKRVRKVKGPVLCLVGPPGVGKTSLGRSIARAMGREFVRDVSFVPEGEVRGRFLQEEIERVDHHHLGDQVDLEPLGAMWQRLIAAGRVLALADGETATMNLGLPAALAATAPATVVVWQLDTETGIWHEVGEAPLVDGIVVKLAKVGGIGPALRQIRLARELGMKVMLGCMVESSVGVAAAAMVASEVDWLDLDGNLLIGQGFLGLFLLE